MYAAWQMIWYLLGDHPLFSRYLACQSYGLSSFSSMKIASLGSPSFWTCWTRPSNYCTDVAFTANSAANSIKKRDFCRNLLPIPARMIDGSVKPKPVIQMGFSRDGTFPSVRGTLFLFMYNHIYIYAHKDHHPHTHSHIYRICHTRIYIYTHNHTHIYISLSCILLQYTNPMYKLYDVGAYHVCLGPKIPPPCQRATVRHHSSIESYGESPKYRPWL